MSDILKVAIADDEHMVCVVIKDSIDFDGIGLELVGVAQDGLHLLDIINEHNPDIVITDIMMPGMNGIEIIKEVRERSIKCKFIIISGFSQFKYAQNAIKYKVEDYLLKPIDAQELNRTLGKLKQEILSERDNIAEKSVAIENSKKSKEALRKIFMYRVLSGFEIPEDKSKIEKEYCLRLYGRLFQCAVIKLDMDDQSLQKESCSESIQSKILRIFINFLSPKCQEIIEFTDNNLLYVIVNYMPEQQRAIMDALRDSFEHAQNIINIFGGLKITAGISTARENQNMSDLRVSIDEALRATYHRMILGTNRMIFFNRLLDTHQNFTGAKRKMLLERLKKDIQAFNIEDYKKCMNDIFDAASINPEEVINLSFEIEKFCFEQVKSADGNDADDEKYQRYCLHQGIINSTSVLQLKKHMRGSVVSIMAQRLEAYRQQDAKPIRDAIRFIQEHYAEDIGLERVADEILLNHIYFSSVFKKETGENFLEFLNKYRIEKAKDLLRTTNKKISIISETVGFNDPKYFAKLFRKFVGLKPTEYRNIYG